MNRHYLAHHGVSEAKVLPEDEDFLEHWGVKGMRWGVRNAPKPGGRKDKKWEREINSSKTYIKVHNAAARKANEIDVPRINNDPKYKNKDFTSDSPLRREYYQAHEDSFNKRMIEAAEEIIGSNPSGTKRIHIDRQTGQTTLVDIKHAEATEQVVLKFDSMGHILSFKIVDDILEQSAFVDNFLEHYGVKGMRWGVRQKRPGVKLSGDAQKARKYRGKPASSLTNKQLRELNERIKLEQNYKKLNPGKKTRGEEAVKGVLATAGLGITVYNMAKSPAGKAAIEAGKKFVGRTPSKAFSLTDLATWK